MEVLPEGIDPTMTEFIALCPSDTEIITTTSTEVVSDAHETSISCPGTELESEVDHCINNPCENGGTCYNTTKGHICICPEYFSGNNCQTGIKKKYK